MCVSQLQSFIPPTCLRQLHRVSGFLVWFSLKIFGAIQIYILICAAYALKNLLTGTAVPLAKMMGRDNRNQKGVIRSLHRFLLLILFLKVDFSVAMVV